MSTINLDTPTLQLAVPIRKDQEGDLRVGQTRVMLDTVVYAHRMGRTPEQIVQSFPTLDLRDVYTVLAWYLNNRTDVDAYIEQREKAGEEIRQRIEKLQGSSEGLKAKLLARLAAQGTSTQKDNSERATANV